MGILRYDDCDDQRGRACNDFAKGRNHEHLRATRKHYRQNESHCDGGCHVHAHGNSCGKRWRHGDERQGRNQLPGDLLGKFPAGDGGHSHGACEQQLDIHRMEWTVHRHRDVRGYDEFESNCHGNFRAGQSARDDFAWSRGQHDCNGRSWGHGRVPTGVDFDRFHRNCDAHLRKPAAHDYVQRHSRHSTSDQHIDDSHCHRGEHVLLVDSSAVRLARERASR